MSFRYIAGLLGTAPVVVGPVDGEGGSAGGIHGADLVLGESCGAESEQFQTVMLRDPLREAGDVGWRQLSLGRGSGDALPACDPIVCVLGQVGENGEGQDVVDHFLVPLEHLLQVLTDTGRLRDLLQKPDVAIQAIHIIPFVGRPSSPALVG